MSFSFEDALASVGIERRPLRPQRRVRLSGREVLTSQEFSQENFPYTLKDTYLSLGAEGTYFLAREVYECVRRYERSANVHQSRPAEARREISEILKISRQNPTPKRLKRLCAMLLELSVPAHVYFGVDGETVTWRKFVSALQLSQSSGNQSLAFREIADLTKTALTTIPADKGGPVRDVSLHRLFSCLRWNYEQAVVTPVQYRPPRIHSRKIVKFNWQKPLPRSRPRRPATFNKRMKEGFSKLCSEIVDRLGNELADKDVAHYIQEVLSYGRRATIDGRLPFGRSTPTPKKKSH